MQDHEARASNLNRKLIFSFFLLFSLSKLLKHNKQGPKFAAQFPTVKFSDMLKTGIVWQEETFKIEKSGGCQVVFFVFSIFVVFFLAERKPCLTNFF